MTLQVYLKRKPLEPLKTLSRKKTKKFFLLGKGAFQERPKSGHLVVIYGICFFLSNSLLISLAYILWERCDVYLLSPSTIYIKEVFTLKNAHEMSHITSKMHMKCRISKVLWALLSQGFEPLLGLFDYLISYAQSKRASSRGEVEKGVHSQKCTWNVAYHFKNALEMSHIKSAFMLTLPRVWTTFGAIWLSYLLCTTKESQLKGGK